MNPQRTHYDPLSRALHWLTAVLVVAAFVLGPEHVGRLVRQGVDPATRSDIVWHESLGALVMALTVLRLLWAAVRPQAPAFDMPAWMHRLARLTRVALWGLLLAVPLTGLLGLASDGLALTLLGGWRVDLPGLLGHSPLARLADWGEVHEAVANLILWLSGLHAVAALWHHHVLRDGVLRAMLPPRR